MRQKIVIVLFLLLGLVVLYERSEWFAGGGLPGGDSSLEQLENAYANKSKGVWVTGSGTVIAVLKDDTKGSRHQRFILELANSQTLLISHNIDLAPRIDTLKKNDTVEFSGEYEWTPKGGVVHWTHHDPGGRHQGGWLRHHGREYR